MTPEYSFPIDITQLPSKGRVYDLSANPDERARVAERLGVSELTKLDAKITLVPAAGGLITVNGTLQAQVVQQCVVSLEPVAATIDENFDLAFSRGAPERKGEPELDLSAEDDAPDALVGDELDLGELVVEQLALLIDPYPRAPGAVFKNPGPDGEDAEKPAVSPFAVLAKLKTNNKNN
jgi:uncharacterized metal-binding protein YceD (DUF177 family)